MTINLNLAALNAFRALDNLAPFADFRNARHAAPLATYEVEYTTAATNLLEDALLAEQEAKANEAATTEIVNATTKLPSYKSIPHRAHSLIESPVAFVHGFLNANPGLTRKAAVIALTQVHGINYSTARTQFQVWFKAQKDAVKVDADADAGE